MLALDPPGDPDDRRVHRRRPARAAQPPLRAHARPRARRDGRARRRARRQLGRQGREERRRLRPRQAASAARAARSASSAAPACACTRCPTLRRRSSRPCRRRRRRGEAAGDPPLDARAERARRDRRAAGRAVRGRCRGGRVQLDAARELVGGKRAGDEVWDEVRARPRPQVTSRRPRPPRARTSASAAELAARVIDRELIDACTHCGFCLPTCPTYGPLGQMEADSPRGRIWLMKGLADGTMTANSAVVEHIDRCLGCMACVTACPSGVRYDLLIEQTREVVEEQYERPGRRLAACARSSSPSFRTAGGCGSHSRVAPPAGMPLPKALRSLAELAPPWRSHERPPEVMQAEGERRGRVGLLTGCVQSVVFGDVNVATARVLAAEGFEVVDAARSGAAAARSTSTQDGASEGSGWRAAAGRTVPRGRRRDRRQRRRLRLASQGGGARRARRRRVRAAGGGAESRAASARRCVSRSRTRATCPMRRGFASSRASCSTRSPASNALEPAEQAICCGSARDLQPHAAGSGA